VKNGTSLYLDLVRFSAALMVFQEHLRERTRRSLDAFWGLHPRWDLYSPALAQAAVIVFFVLSGYVIAHVLSTRERTPLEYSSSRLARLYSVVIPALVLVAATNWLEALKWPDDFNRAPILHSGIPPSISYLGTAVFVNDFWLWPDLEPPNAYPFWSLSLEASYYVGIGLSTFAKGRIRFLCLVLLGAVAGPAMVVLAPTWLLGYWVYHFLQRQPFYGRSLVIVWIGSIFLLLLCPLIEINVLVRLPFLRIPNPTLGTLMAGYAEAVCFALSLVMFDAFSETAESILRSFAKTIRWLGSMTFSLYLFHEPLVSFFTFYNLADRSSAAHAIWLVGSTFLVVATFGRFCEQSKSWYKRFLMSKLRYLF
jgi:peptidoglycan/LPS O-acetylase OafA/YrhL